VPAHILRRWGARPVTLSADEGLDVVLRVTADQSEPRTPFHWDELARVTPQPPPTRWWAEDADYDQEETLSFGALERAADRVAERLLEAPDGARAAGRVQGMG
jgi:hypothetical protein